MGVSILDLTNSNPWSRIPNSEYHTLFGIRDWLRLKTLSESFLYQRVAPRSSLRRGPSNKSSQTQVEDFVTSGFDSDPLKRLRDLETEEKVPQVKRKIRKRKEDACESSVVELPENPPSPPPKTRNKIFSPELNDIKLKSLQEFEALMKKIVEIFRPNDEKSFNKMLGLPNLRNENV